MEKKRVLPFQFILQAAGNGSNGRPTRNRALTLYTLVALLLAACILPSCGPNRDFEVSGFNPFANFKPAGDTLALPMDLSDAVIDGITIPSQRQDAARFFKLNFEITNTSDKPQAYYYKVYYQNESYKLTEFKERNDSVFYNEKASNNFYGSWEDTLDGFHKTAIIPNDGQKHMVTDSFRIVGNPRNESRYFGAPTALTGLTNEHIKESMAIIKGDANWNEQVKTKAKKENLSYEEQLMKDALWIIHQKSDKGNTNNRWKRNPRVGTYGFLLAVATQEEHEKLPETVKNIQKAQDGRFIDPYYDLLHNPYFEREMIAVVQAKQVLKTYAKFDLGKGIYIDRLRYGNPKIDTTHFNENCGASEKFFQHSQFEQLFHNIDKNNIVNNIPVIYDVAGDNYTQAQYNENMTKFKPEEIISDYVKITETPGKTIRSDAATNSLIISTPGNKPNEYRKELVGINGRIGFTYGKFIAKVKFPAIISKENVWNGLTIAYWLKNQGQQEWNNRSDCDSVGYIAKGDDNPDHPRIPTTNYSEIDFEILKGSQFWPKSSYPDLKIIPVDDPKSNHNIIVNCTNWDLACNTRKYGSGAKEIAYENKKYIVHRWDHWHRALTTKYEVNHDSVFNRPYYYEIDWHPERIVWRIGSSKDKMMTVAYMDKSVTAIPDNQMVVHFSQEFHDSKWWPLSPFMQEFIPFPKNDIVTEVLEIVVE